MSAPAFPRPLLPGDGDAAHYWAALSEGRVELPRCRTCDNWIFYPKPFCPSCHGADVAWEEVAGTGRVHTFSIVHRATHPWFMDKTPYVYGLVELDVGVRLPSTIVGCRPEEVKIGLAVAPVFENVAEGITLLFHRPRPA